MEIKIYRYGTNLYVSRIKIGVVGKTSEEALSNLRLKIAAIMLDEKTWGDVTQSL